MQLVKYDVVKKDVYNAKIKNIQDKVLDITNFATNTTLNAKTNEIKNEILSITNLVTTLLLLLLKIKYLMLVIQSEIEIMIQKYQKWKKKCFTTSDYNKFTSHTFDANITQKKLINQSGLDER